MKHLIYGRVSYDAVDGKGNLKKEQEEFEVEAITFAEAEYRLLEEVKGNENPSVEAVRKSSTTFSWMTMLSFSSGVLWPW